MFEKLRALAAEHREVIAYLFWGAMTTAVSWASYTLLALLLRGVGRELTLLGRGVSVTVLVANVFSWVCAVLFAFVTNKLRVFRSASWQRAVVLPEFAKFIASRLATGILEIVAVPALVAFGLDQAIGGVEGMVAKILVTVVVVILNYVLSKLLVFRRREE